MHFFTKLMRPFLLKHFYAVLIFLALMPVAFAGITSIRVGNAAPVFMDSSGKPAYPSDGGIGRTNPLHFDESVTFRAKATDDNGDDYYLAICKTDAIIPKNLAPPLCKNGTWAISGAVKSGEEASAIYKADKEAKLKNDWYAFVCDHAESGSCSKSSQGNGESGSPFYVHKQVGVLRFDKESCPELKELDELKKPVLDSKSASEPVKSQFVALDKKLTDKEAEKIIENELNANNKKDDVKYQELKIIKEEVKALKEIKESVGKVDTYQIEAVAASLIKEREKLSKLAKANVNFCITTSTDDTIQNVIDKRGKSVQKKTEHDVKTEGLNLKFNKDDERSISMNFRQATAKKDDSKNKIEGPDIKYKKKGGKNKLEGPKEIQKEQAKEKKESKDSYKTITLKHEIVEETKEKQSLISRLIGKNVGAGHVQPENESEKTSVQTSFEMNAVEPVKTGKTTEEEVVYQSADSRKTDVYKYKNSKNSITPHTIKNYTIFHYGRGKESELYSFNGAVLHIRADGVIEGFYVENIDLGKEKDAKKVSRSLLDRASRTLTKDYAENLHKNGGKNPDFIIPKPFAIDKESNILTDFKYEIAGEYYDKLKITFGAALDAYPIVLDPSLQFTAPGSVENVSENITGENNGDFFGHNFITGDLDNDGKKDLVIGAYTYNTDQGRVYVFYNSESIPTSAASADEIITGESGSYFGYSVNIGDLDADGDSDLIIGGWGYNSRQGKVYIFNNDGNYPGSAASADTVIIGEDNSDFGMEITLGDLDGDGDLDLAVTAPSYNIDQGRAYIFYQDGSWPASAGSADIIIEGEADASKFGYTGIIAGDFNANGKTDLAVSTANYNGNQGRIYIFDNDGVYPASADSADSIITGEAGSSFGISVSSGDLDGDGDTDLAAGADSYNGGDGRVYIFYNDGAYPAAAGNADVIVTGETGSGLGITVAAGDLNSDGKTDLAAGASGYAVNTGRAYILYGNGSGAFGDSGCTTACTASGNANVIITGENSGDLFGRRIIVDDINFDGANDLIAGAPQYSSSIGRVYIFYGEGGEEYKGSLTGENTNNYFGYSAAVGDVNADGEDDIIIGAYGYNNGAANDGKVYIFYGNGSSPAVAVADDIISGAASGGGKFGYAIAIGDMDSDGDEDIVVGAPELTASMGIVYVFANSGALYPDVGGGELSIAGHAAGEEFGSTIAVGDLDMDGDKDIVVGALGSANGTVYTHVNSSGTFDSYDTISGAGAGDQFGYSIALGDVDTDNDKNFEDNDIIIGAPGTTNGTVYIFYIENNALGFPASASSADDIINGAAAGDEFGSSIDVGDIDADQDDDIIIGAPGTANGTVYIFYNPDGAPHATSYPDAGSADDTIAGAAAGDEFGFSIAVADMDDDGDDDIVISAPETGTTKGTVYIFYNTGALYPNAGSADIIIDGEANNSGFGNYLIIADLNADRVNDLFVGASQYTTNSGRAYVFYGDSGYSWNTKFPWKSNLDGTYHGGSNRHKIEGWTSGSLFGASLASGDLNGDGKRDLIVGAPDYNSQQGRIYIFLNDGQLPMNTYEADVTITGSAVDDQFGFSMAANKLSTTRDIIDDLIVGAPGADSNDGKVYLFNGRSNWSGIDSYSDADFTFSGIPGDADNFGYSVVAEADLSITPDIHNDIIIGAPETANGTVYMFFNDGSYSADAITADIILNGASAGSKFGYSLATGELSITSDKYVDLIIGAPSYNSNQGRVYLSYNDGSYDLDVTFTGETTGDQFGYSLSTGELSTARDNRTDIVVGAPFYNSNQGRVYLYYNDGTYGSADWTTTGGNTGDRLGESIAVGDLSRDGRADLIAGMPGYDSGGNSGIARVYYNLNAGKILSDSLINNTGNNSYAGGSLLIADIDGDSRNDLITGAETAYDNRGIVLIDDFSMEQMSVSGETSPLYGHSMTIGDFNGDGENDFAVGAPAYNSSQGQVYVFFDDILSIIKAINPTPDVTITGSAAGDEFGYSLSAGKISETADAMDDLIIGAPGAASDVGWAYIFNGRTSWNSAYSAATDYSNRLKDNGSNQRCGTAVMAGYDLIGDSREDFVFACTGVIGSGSGEHYIDICENDGSYPVDTFCANFIDISNSNRGASLAAGDIDNDGWLDLIVGDPSVSTNNGGVYVYYGLDHPSGIDTSVGITITGESDSKFGASIAIGDFNAAGRDDILVGAPEYNTDQGRAYIFYNDGSIPTTAASSDQTITGAAGSYFGQAVASVDYNVDGKMDVAVGAESHLYAFFNDGSYGSSNSASDADLNDTRSSYATFARQFAVGDLNYDGRDDILFGAPGSGNGIVLFYQNARVQCEPPSLDSIAISDTGGFTNDATPEISLTYSYDTGSGLVPTYAQFSCDGGMNWSAQTAVIGAGSPVTVSTFNITSGATGCTATEGNKTITAKLMNSCGFYTGDFASDTTYYDVTGPTVSDFSSVNDSSAQITVTANVTGDGTGAGEPYQYMFSGDGCTGNQPEGSWTADSDNNDAFTGLSPNTQYSFKVKARDELENEGSYTACGTSIYTSASTPNAPVLSNPAANTIDVDPLTAGAEKDMAIYVATGGAGNCNGAGGIGYVQSVDGSIGPAEDWRADAVWGTKTVTGLSTGITYYFCVKARNVDDDETGFGSVENETTVGAPSFDTGYPSDNVSASDIPTHVGQNVTFDARIAGDTDDFWLLVCKTNGAPTVGSPPECNGGSGNRWARSSQTIFTEIATATYTALIGDSESNAWYAFVCDATVCSSASQGSGDNGSPFNVNHAGTFGSISFTDTGGNASIEPGDTMRFTINNADLADSDTDGTQDLMEMYVCNSTTGSFEYGTLTCVGGALHCSDTGVNPTSENASCDDSLNIIPVPTAHGSYNVKVYVFDNHGMAATGTETQSFTVQDVAPTLISYTATDLPAPTAGGSDTVDFIVHLQDNNGEDDVTSVEGYFFDDDEINLSGGACTEDENNCYLDSVCTLVTAYGDDSQLEAQCQALVWFNANESGNWEVHANPTDGLGKTTNFSDSNVNIVNEALSAISVAEADIDYGAIGIGITSAIQAITIRNSGNQIIDAGISGGNMTSGLNIIGRSSQKLSDVSGFAYSAGYSLVEVPATLSPATGCFDVNLPVRNIHDNGAGSDDNIYWRLQAPSSLKAGSYSGTNTISFITCD